MIVLCRYEKRQALKARFEIERKLRREKKAGKRRQKEKEEKRRRGVRARPEDKTKSRAMDDLKAKRSAGELPQARGNSSMHVYLYLRVWSVVNLTCLT